MGTEEQPRTLLTEAQIEKFANKKWDIDLIDTEGKVFAEERSQESKEKSLRNLRPVAKKPNEEEIAEEIAPELEDLAYLSAVGILNPDEKKYFKSQWNKYMKDYNIQTAAEQSFVVDIIMEEITANKLRTTYYKKDNPPINLDEQLKKCSERKDKAYNKLAAFKKEKWSDIEEAKSLAQLILEADKRARLFEEKEPEYLKEEEELLGKNMKQFEIDLLEAEQGHMDQEIIERAESIRTETPPPPPMEPEKQVYGIYNYISLSGRQPTKK
ncbi:MAG: hypothetical protein WC476_01010 [Phycisphaerae bacterium]|jgi:hypothetical protein